MVNRKPNVPTRKTRKTKRVVRQMQQMSLKPTPFGDSGSIAGRGLSRMLGFGPGVGASVGRWLGSGIGSIFGSGDYKVAGEGVTNNILVNSREVPQFTRGKGTTICHREFISDLSGTSAFTNTQYIINPGLVASFPWLNAFAQNFEEYRIHGMIFEFKSTSSEYNTGGNALGSVIMATQYNVQSPAFTNKVAMENYDFAVSCKPSESMIHAIECKGSEGVLKNYFVRTNSYTPTGVDNRFTDFATFNLATVGNSSTNIIGELWCSYCIEFFKPRVPATIGGGVLTAHYCRTSPSSASPFGTALALSSGSLSLTVSGTTITWVGTVGQTYYISLLWGTSSASTVVPTISFTNGSQPTYFGNDLYGSIATPNGTNTVSNVAYASFFTVNATGACAITAASATITSGVTVDIIITEVDSAVAK